MLETTITSVDGTKLAARHSGHGSPMVLVHGAIGSLETFASHLGPARRATLGVGLLPPGPRWQWRWPPLRSRSRGRRRVGRPRRRGRPGPSPRTFRRSDLQPLGRHPMRPSLRSLVLYEPPFHGDRFDPNLVDAVQAALDAGDPDLARRPCFPRALPSRRRCRSSVRCQRCGRGPAKVSASSPVNRGPPPKPSTD